MYSVRVFVDGRSWLELWTNDEWRKWKARFDKVGIKYAVTNAG